MFFKKRKPRFDGERFYVLDTCIFLKELGLIKKLDRFLRTKKSWQPGKIVVPYAIIQELRGLRQNERKSGRAEKALTLIDAKASNLSPVWCIERSKGTGIAKQLLADSELKALSTNDIRILAVAIMLKDEGWRNGRNRRVYIVTWDKSFKAGAHRYNVRIIGTLKWMWKLNRFLFKIEMRIKRWRKRNGHYNGGHS